MKTIFETVEEIKNANLTKDELLLKYNEIIQMEKFYLQIINNEKNKRYEAERERNLAICNVDFRNNYPEYIKTKKLQNKRVPGKLNR